MCKILKLPLEVKKIWFRRRLMPWFRANKNAWWYENAKKQMSKQSRVCSSYKMDLGSEAFKRAFVMNRSAVLNAVKKNVENI